jgi:hypothetical protein
MAPNLLLHRRAGDGPARRENRRSNQQEDRVADYKVTVEEQADGKWACFLHVPGEEPYNLGKSFKNEDRAEAWLTVGEATTAIDMAVAKLTKK